MSALNLSDGAGVGSPRGTDLLPSTRITQETEEKKSFGSSLWGRASGTVFAPERFNRGDCKSKEGLIQHLTPLSLINNVCLKK